MVSQLEQNNHKNDDIYLYFKLLSQSVPSKERNIITKALKFGKQIITSTLIKFNDDKSIYNN